MKRVLASTLGLLLAAPLFAAEPVTLDRNGILWRLSATPSGTVLVGTKDGEEVARSVVPFPLGASGQYDNHLQLVADERAGKIVVAWQRNWTPQLSSIMLAVWDGGAWEHVRYLTTDLAANPRNPVLHLVRKATTYETPGDNPQTVTADDSFALVAWWEGTDSNQRARVAALCLTMPSTEEENLVVWDLPTAPGIGFQCPQPLEKEVIEEPLFATQPPSPSAYLLVASPSVCLMFVYEIRLELQAPAQDESQSPLNAVAMRRRHTPIFGVRKVLPVTRELSAEGTRAVLGADLQPVLYRVVPEGVEYTVATETGWSPKRLLKLEEGLGLDKAIALVENLAR